MIIKGSSTPSCRIKQTQTKDDKLLDEKDNEHFTRIKNQYHNDNIADIVKQVLEDNKIVEYKVHLYSEVDPVPRHALDFRSHFYAPRKHIAGLYIHTYWFNMMMVWLPC